VPRYLKPAATGKVAIAVCGRCKFKMNYNELSSDRNIPGLMVCKECNDLKDPYKLPSKRPEKVTLQHPRPDEPLIMPTE